MKRRVVMATLTASLIALPAAAGGQARVEHDSAFDVRVTGSGSPIILIPGLLSSGAVWDELVAHLAPSHELHVLTLAGFADGPAPAPAHVDTILAWQRDAIVAYIERLQLERPVLIGHSLGAFLSFWIAAHAPAAVGGVIAVDGVPWLVALGDTAARAQDQESTAANMRALFASLTPEQVGMQTRMGASTQTADSTRWDVIGRWASSSDPATIGRTVAEMLVTDLRDDVAAVRVPVLLIAAAGAARDADALAGIRARYEAQVREIPGARVVVAEGARHFVMWDAPEFLHEQVTAFMEDVR